MINVLIWLGAVVLWFLVILLVLRFFSVNDID